MPLLVRESCGGAGPDVPEDSMPIRACPDCCSDRLSFPTKGSTVFSCEDCPWAGTPDEFASWSEWQESRVAKASRTVIAP